MFWPVGDQCGPGQTLCPGTILMATAQPCPTPTPTCARLSLCVSSSPSAGCSVAVAPEPGLWKQCNSLAQVQTHMTGPQQPQNTAEHLLAYWLSVRTGRGSPGPQRRAGPDRGLHTRLRSPTPLPLAAPSHQSPSGWLSLHAPFPVPETYLSLLSTSSLPSSLLLTPSCYLFLLLESLPEKSLSQKSLSWCSRFGQDSPLYVFSAPCASPSSHC